jgi:hypothetical protein
LPVERVDHALRKVAPTLASQVDELCAIWLAPLEAKLKAGTKSQFRPKQINDPVWGSIELFPWEVALLDSPMLQRMRGVRQLGLAQLVFPGAGHDRLEHIIGVVGAVERMIRALQRQIERWNLENKPLGKSLVEIRDQDRYALRLAGMFHDLGHGPFSHAMEPVLEHVSPLGGVESGDSQWRMEIRLARNELKRLYSLNNSPATSEVLAVMFVLSDAVSRVLSSDRFFTQGMVSGVELQERIVACIIGGVEGPGADHLSAVVSSQIDADRLDFLSRDAHHAGLEIGFDTDRLLSRLEVLQVRDDNLDTADQSLRERIGRSPEGTFLQIGIAASGFGSFEQMLIGRTFLYDRLYHHHKVRSAEAMAQRLMVVAERDRKRRFDLKEIFVSIGDDTMLRIMAEEVIHPKIKTSSPAAAGLAKAILNRELLHRAFAFRGRFIASPPGFEKDIAERNRTELWRQIVKELDDLNQRYLLGQEIHALAVRIAETIKNAGIASEEMDNFIIALGQAGPEQIIVDLPVRKAAAIRILARYPDGTLKVPEFSFNPVKWADAYDLQKRTGYVFCPKEMVPIIALATRIVFLGRFGVTMGTDADGYIKAGQSIDANWLEPIVAEGIIDTEAAETLRAKRYSLLRVRSDNLAVPEGWLKQDPDFAASLAVSINKYLRGGLTAKGLDVLHKTLAALWAFVDNWYAGTRLTSELELEAGLQKFIVEHLRAHALSITEGSAVGGGELDVFVEDELLIENKFHRETTNPDKVATGGGMQGRRYTLALNSQIVVVLLGYQLPPKTPVPQKIDTVKISQIVEEDRNRVEIRISLPYGAPVPSSEKPQENVG